MVENQDKNKNKEIINCPKCGGPVAKRVTGIKTMIIRCPHCGADIKVSNKLVVEAKDA